MEHSCESRTNPLVHGQLISAKDAKAIQWGKDGLFNKWCGDNWMSHAKN